MLLDLTTVAIRVAHPTRLGSRVQIVLGSCIQIVWDITRLWTRSQVWGRLMCPNAEVGRRLLPQARQFSIRATPWSALTVHRFYFSSYLTPI